MPRLIYKISLSALLLFPLATQASFIESSMGTAVVNDATATYYNPAALVQLKNPQLVALNSISYFHSRFEGTVTSVGSGVAQTGSSSANNQYYLPALYFGMPLTHQFVGGVAIIANNVNRDIENYSTLRYLQPNNNIQDIDFVPAFSFKINDVVAVGAGLLLTHAYFLMQPIYGVPGSNIPDNQSRNESSGNAWGSDIGLFIKPNSTTTIGLNYRSAITYRMSGTSTLTHSPNVYSHHYYFTYWIPARSVFSMNHFVTKKLGFIATAQYIQWNVFQNVTAHNVAVQTSQAVILPVSIAPYHFHNSWIWTAGSHYRFSPDFIWRLAGSYIQSPSNGSYQIDNGDSFILGTSIGYQLSQKISVDGSYAHAFVKNKNIHIVSALRTINGVNQNAGNAFSVKLTFDI